MRPFIRLVTLAPGHFHAALVQKRSHPAIHSHTFVYAPLHDDLLAYLDRIAQFNARTLDPTSWRLDIRVGDNFFDQFTREPLGNTCVVTGRNRTKIEYIRAAIQTGRHVLADKPWIIEPDDFPKLETVFHDAEVRDLVAWDMMTERFEITSRLQRELVQDRVVFGTLEPGTSSEPALTLESVHYLNKTVAGRPLVRPEWWFDPTEAGQGIADVGTHLADLAMWLLFPDSLIDYRRDVQMLSVLGWPTMLTAEQFTTVTGKPSPSAELIARHPDRDPLRYHGNGVVNYTLRGVSVRLTVRWDYEAPPGMADSHFAEVRGSRAAVTIRPVTLPNAPMRHELFVTANDSADRGPLLAVLREKCAGWQREYPGIAVRDQGTTCQLVIPDGLRSSHEDHFAAVIDEFAGHVGKPRQIPLCERANLLAKYFVTTQAVAMMRLNPAST